MPGFNKKYFVGFVVMLALLAAVYFFLRPAFAGEIAIPSEINLGVYSLRIYSLTMLTGVLAAVFVAKKLARRFSILDADLENLALVCVFFGLLGARLHHVLTEWGFYADHPQLIWQFWRGGLGFFGGVFGAVAGVAAYCRIKHLDFWKVCDVLAVAAPLGQAIGRWGNFFNQEAYGLPTDLPWKMYVSFERRLPALENYDFFHPWFLYESLVDFCIFLLLFHLARRTPLLPRGFLLAGYLLVYSVARFWLEPMRADATLISGLLLNQLLALAFTAAALTAFIVRARASGRGD